MRFNCGVRHSDVMLASLLSSCFCLQSKHACKCTGGLHLIDEICIPLMCIHDVYARGSQIYCVGGSAIVRSLCFVRVYLVTSL